MLFSIEANPFDLLKIGAVVSSISIVVSKGYPFQRLRNFLQKWKVLGKLVNCPFCLNCHLSLWASLLFDRPAELFIHWLVVVALAHAFNLVAILLIRKLEEH